MDEVSTQRPRAWTGLALCCGLAIAASALAAGTPDGARQTATPSGATGAPAATPRPPGSPAPAATPRPTDPPPVDGLPASALPIPGTWFECPPVSASAGLGGGALGPDATGLGRPSPQPGCL